MTFPLGYHSKFSGVEHCILQIELPKVPLNILKFYPLFLHFSRIVWKQEDFNIINSQSSTHTSSFSKNCISVLIVQKFKQKGARRVTCKQGAHWYSISARSTENMRVKDSLPNTVSNQFSIKATRFFPSAYSGLPIARTFLRLILF